MLDLLLMPAVQKTLCQPRQQIQALVGLAQQKGSPIGTDRTSVKTGHNLTLPAGFKSEAGLDTICHSEGRPLLALTVVWKLSYAMKDGLLPSTCEKCGLAAEAIWAVRLDYGRAVRQR